MILLASIVLFAAAWANRGSFPPATLYLPGIVLGAYIAWGARAALFAVIPLAAYFGLIMSNAHVTEGGRLGFNPSELLDMLVAAGALSCVWIVLFGSSFRSATTDAQRALASANQQLETALIAAQQANRAKSDFIANMSHEVRTPLNGVLGMTNVLQADPSLTDDHRRSLELIDDSGKALLELLNDILDLSKIEADALELENREFDLAELIRNMTDHWRPQAESKGVVLTVQNQLGVPCFVKGDPVRLRQVVNNLLSNAVKFTHSGRISVSLATVGFDAFGDGGGALVREHYRKLPEPEGWRFHNRFVGDYLLYAAGGYGDESTTPTVYAVPLDGRDVQEVALKHGVTRFDRMGSDGIVVGPSKGGALGFTSLSLGREAKVEDTYMLAAANEGETRSQAFFFKPDPGSRDGVSGTLGLPISRRAERNGAEFLGSGSAIAFLRREERKLNPAGELAARMESARPDNCIASCVDWYGNARPIFMGNRIFALMGYEIVEGSMNDGRIREERRVSFAPQG